VLLDELTVWGDAAEARGAVDRWYAAGADMPIIVLPPGAPLDELDDTLETLSPLGVAGRGAVRHHEQGP
jgi:hypothetical protein